MTLKINGEDLELIYSFRSSIYFEQISNKSLDFNNFTGNDLMNLFYCVVIASLQKNKKPIIKMLDFMDAVDENGGDKCILEFSNWYIDTLNSQYEINDASIKEKEESPSKKKEN